MEKPLMSTINSELELCMDTWYYDVYRFSFLVTGNGKSAEEITFQTFLYIGAEQEIPDKIQVFQKAYLTCEDYFLRRMRRLKSREHVQESVTFPVTDLVWEYLKRPAEQKAALFLLDYLWLSASEAGLIMGISASKVKLLYHRQSDLPRSEFLAILPDEAFTAQFADSVYVRFEERNVGLENRLRQMRFKLDRAILWIAFAIILLFAAAAFYTSRL